MVYDFQTYNTLHICQYLICLFHHFAEHGSFKYHSHHQSISCISGFSLRRCTPYKICSISPFLFYYRSSLTIIRPLWKILAPQWYLKVIRRNITGVRRTLTAICVQVQNIESNPYSLYHVNRNLALVFFIDLLNISEENSQKDSLNDSLD